MKNTKYAGFGKRFAAWIIDMLVCVGIGFIQGIITAIIPHNNNQITANILSLIITWLYFSLMESSTKQATLGKMALGIKVIDYKGKRISFGRATSRYFSKYLSALLLGIGFFSVAWDEKKQALHDKIANTYVVKK